MKKISYFHLLVRRPIILAPFIVFCLVGCKSGALPRTSQFEDKAKLLNVGMVMLLANPEHYDGHVIRTIGFLAVENEGDALYLHKEDYRCGLTQNSFALRLDESQRKQWKDANLKYVIIEARLNAYGLERDDRWGGAIDHITRLEAWPIDREPPSH